MKVRIVIVLCLIVGLFAYIEFRPTMMKVANSGTSYNAFRDDEAIWVVNQLNGQREQEKTNFDGKLASSVSQLESSVRSLEEAGDVSKLEKDVELRLIDFYSADQSRFKFDLVPYSGTDWSPKLHYYYHVRVETGKFRGKEFFMDPGSVAEPRPRVPGEPGRE